LSSVVPPALCPPLPRWRLLSLGSCGMRLAFCLGLLLFDLCLGFSFVAFCLGRLLLAGLLQSGLVGGVHLPPAFRGPFLGEVHAGILAAFLDRRMVVGPGRVNLVVGKGKDDILPFCGARNHPKSFGFFTTYRYRQTSLGYGRGPVAHRWRRPCAGSGLCGSALAREAALFVPR
jgi:hypothetical protein